MRARMTAQFMLKEMMPGICNAGKDGSGAAAAAAESSDAGGSDAAAKAAEAEVHDARPRDATENRRPSLEGVEVDEQDRLVCAVRETPLLVEQVRHQHTNGAAFTPPPIPTAHTPRNAAGLADKATLALRCFLLFSFSCTLRFFFHPAYCILTFLHLLCVLPSQHSC